MTSKEAYNYLLGLLELEDDIRWPLVKESIGKFKELIEQQSISTLSECIKEWEKRGWELIRHERRYIAFQNSEGTFITISNYSQPTYEKHWNGRSQGITLEEHNLINKTIKAWEGTKGE